MKTKVMLVYGTRPEAIKMAPVVRALKQSSEFATTVTVTGQHREMLDQVNRLFEIEPDHDLNVLRHGQSLSGLSASVLRGLDDLLVQGQPDAVIVQGDTTTAAASALAAFNRGVCVIHLEAGLRSGNLALPFPEEGNRRMIGQLAQLHLAPTIEAKRNLLREGIEGSAIAVTGNSVIDALFEAIARPGGVIEDERLRANLLGERVLLVTTHRRESWGHAMEQVGAAIRVIARRLPDVRIVLPLHRNPVVREALLPAVGSVANVLVTEPLQYHDFVRVLQASHVVLTDSGGVQEEAPALGKPVLVMRDTTERPEAVTSGVARLVGTDPKRIEEEVVRLFEDSSEYSAMSHAINPYGDGRAAARSVAAISALFGHGERLPDFSESDSAGLVRE